MPDLTIKPNIGNGNKVIIQDQAGNPVLTTENSGATLGSGVNLSAAIGSLTGVDGISVKVHHITGAGDTSDQASGFNYGPELNIASTYNPNGAKFLVASGGGRYNFTIDEAVGHIVRHLEGGTSWTTTNGTYNDILMFSKTSGNVGDWHSADTQWSTYTNDSGNATAVSFKMSMYSSSTARVYGNDTNPTGTTGTWGLFAIRIH